MLVLNVNGEEMSFEHSLVALSEWESEYTKCFFTDNKNETRTESEMIFYFQCMYLGPYSNRFKVRLLTPEQKVELIEYMNASRTASVIRELPSQKQGPSDKITTDLIYYWLSTFRIPFKPTDEWHFNRLLATIKIAGIKNTPKDKGKNTKAMAKDFRRINEERRRAANSKG